MSTAVTDHDEVADRPAAPFHAGRGAPQTGTPHLPTKWKKGQQDSNVNCFFSAELVALADHYQPLVGCNEAVLVYLALFPDTSPVLP